MNLIATVMHRQPNPSVGVDVNLILKRKEKMYSVVTLFTA